MINYWNSGLKADKIIAKLEKKISDRSKFKFSSEAKKLSYKEQMLLDYLTDKDEKLLSLEITSTTRLYGALGKMTEEQLREIL